jgi:hypothetical protein
LDGAPGARRVALRLDDAGSGGEKQIPFGNDKQEKQPQRKGSEKGSGKDEKKQVLR